jgi:AraC-like DNA-binding protein
LQRALRYVDEHLSQPLQVTELAAAACVSRFHLVRLFRSGTGASPLRYVRRRRIERARQLLSARICRCPAGAAAGLLSTRAISSAASAPRPAAAPATWPVMPPLLLPPDRVSNGVHHEPCHRHAAPALLSPTDHALVLIDFQSQMAFATHTIDISALRNNVSLISKGAKGFNVPVLLTTVAEASFSGPMFPELPAIFPGQPVFDRTSMNTWEDQPVIDEINRIGKRRLVLAGCGPASASWAGAVGAGAGLRGLRDHRCLRRCQRRSARACDHPHGAGRRGADDQRAVPAGTAARLGTR